MPTQHSATLLGTTWVCLATLLWHVTTCWLEVDHFQTWANNTQHVARHCNTVAKRTQHVVPNNVAICCVSMLGSFGRGLKLLNFAILNFLLFNTEFIDNVFSRTSVNFSMYMRKNIHDWYWGFLVTHNYVYVCVCLCDLMYIICLCYFPLSLKLYFWIQYYLSQFFLFWSSLAHSVNSALTIHYIKYTYVANWRG